MIITLYFWTWIRLRCHKNGPKNWMVHWIFGKIYDIFYIKSDRLVREIKTIQVLDINIYFMVIADYFNNHVSPGQAQMIHKFEDGMSNKFSIWRFVYLSKCYVNARNTSYISRHILYGRRDQLVNNFFLLHQKFIGISSPLQYYYYFSL